MIFVFGPTICPWVSEDVYGPYTHRKVPLRSVQTVRIVKLYKPLSQIRQGNILSVLNEMHFTDRTRTEKCLYDLYKPYGSSNRSPVAQVTHSIRHNEMQFSDCIRTEIVFTICQTVRIVRLLFQTVSVCQTVRIVRLCFQTVSVCLYWT